MQGWQEEEKLLERNEFFTSMAEGCVAFYIDYSSGLRPQAERILQPS